MGTRSMECCGPNEAIRGTSSSSRTKVLTTAPVSSSSTTTTLRQPGLNACDMLISVLECYMMERIRFNERRERTEALHRLRCGIVAPEPSVFHALQAPSITAVEYLRRLARYAFCSRSVFIAAFYYLECVSAKKNVDLAMNTLSVHRLVLTAVLLATKVVDDVLYDNAHFAKVGGLDVKELNMLELDLLKVLNFNLYMSAEQFETFERRMVDMALSTCDPDFAMLPTRLQNLGYSRSQDASSEGKMAPASPSSSMEVSFEERV